MSDHASSSDHDLARRYRLLDIAAEGGGVRSRHAEEFTTGRTVMVHEVDGVRPAVVERLGEQIGRLLPADRRLVLETAAFPAGFAIVTEFLPDLASFPAWLDARVRGADRARSAEPDGSPVAMEFYVGAPAPGGAAAAPAAAGAGEFTRLFVLGGKVSFEPAAAGAAGPERARPASDPARSDSIDAAVVPAQPPAPAPPVASVPAPVVPVTPPLAAGEFTRLFNASTPAPAGVGAASPLVPAGPPSPAPRPPRADVADGLPGARHAPAAGPDAPFAPPPLQPTPASPMVPAQAPRPTTPHAAAAPPYAGGGATGALAARAVPPEALADPLAAFAAFVAPPAGIAPPAAAWRPAEAVASAEGLPPAAVGGVARGPAPFAPAVAPPSASAGPSDYTRLIRNAVAPPPPARARPASPDAAVSPVRFPLRLVVAVNVALLLAAAIVLYFATRPPQPAGSGAPGAAPNGVPNAPPTVAAPRR